MPFGQPVTAPWITMHATGNKPRDHGIYAAIEALFRLSPPYPALDLEPYYTGWMHQNNVVAGEQPTPDSDRDIVEELKPPERSRSDADVEHAPVR